MKFGSTDIVYRCFQNSELEISTYLSALNTKFSNPRRMFKARFVQ